MLIYIYRIAVYLYLKHNIHSYRTGYNSDHKQQTFVEQGLNWQSTNCKQIPTIICNNFIINILLNFKRYEFLSVHLIML